MGRNDWYRRKSWTEEDQRAFFERNRRSRSAHSKAEYIRIQAETLYRTDKDELILPALELLESSLRQYPDAMGRALTLDCAARCCERLSRIDEAIAYYQRALERERDFPGIGTNACYHFAKLVAELERQELFNEALQALDDYHRPAFPWHVYMSSGSRALIAEHRGDQRAAESYALAALRAAEVRDSGLGWGRGEIGVVRNTETEFHERLRRLARTSGIDH